MRPIAQALLLCLLMTVPASVFGPEAAAQTSQSGSAEEASASIVGRFIINNIYGWEGIPGGRLTQGIYVTLYHPRSGTRREVTTDSDGYIHMPRVPSGIWVLKEIIYIAESISGPSELSAPLTPMTCTTEPSTMTYCGTVVFTFQRLPKGKEAYAGLVSPKKPGVQGLDILDESKEARQHFGGAATEGLAFRSSIWTGPKGLPTWEAASHFFQASELSASRSYDKAIPELKEGLKKDPEHAWAHYMLARAYQWQAKDKEAVAEYNKAFKLKPDFAWAHYSLGVLYLLRAEYPASREEFQKAAAIDPGFVPAAFYHLKKLEQMAKVTGTDLDDYKARTPEEESFLSDARAAIKAALDMDWRTCFSYFSDSGRVEAHCGLCDPSKFFSVEELKDYLTQPIAQGFRLNHVKVRVLSLEAADGNAQVTFFNSYELAKTDDEKGWWFADISTVRAKKVDGRWVLTEHQYNDHLH